MKYIDLKKEYLKKEIESSDIDWAIAVKLNKKRTELKNLELTDDDLLLVKPILKRLENKEPLANIFKNTIFYGREFIVNNRVLTPRFETEELVYNAIKLIKSKNLKNVLDLCTGSGSIGLTLKLELPEINVTLSDISEFALQVARDNSRNLKAKVEFKKSDLLDDLNDEYDLIVSNPPYIKDQDINILDIQVKDYDPHISLFAGKDGLHFYREIEKQTLKFKNLRYIIFEIGINQKDDLEKIFSNYEKFFIKDMNNIDRVLIVKR